MGLRFENFEWAYEVNFEKVIYCKDICKILKEVLYDNKDLNFYLEFGSKYVKLIDGVYFLIIFLLLSDRKSVKNFEKELIEFVKKLREDNV